MSSWVVFSFEKLGSEVRRRLARWTGLLARGKRWAGMEEDARVSGFSRADGGMERRVEPG